MRNCRTSSTQTFQGWPIIPSVLSTLSLLKFAPNWHTFTEQVDEILTILGGFESTVFETRAMPRMPPPCQWDMDITETPDARPVAMRH